MMSLTRTTVLLCMLWLLYVVILTRFSLISGSSMEQTEQEGVEWVMGRWIRMLKNNNNMKT